MQKISFPVPPSDRVLKKKAPRIIFVKCFSFSVERMLLPLPSAYLRFSVEGFPSPYFSQMFLLPDQLFRMSPAHESCRCICHCTELKQLFRFGIARLFCSLFQTKLRSFTLLSSFYLCSHFCSWRDIAIPWFTVEAMWFCCLFRCQEVVGDQLCKEKAIKM